MKQFTLALRGSVACAMSNSFFTLLTILSVTLISISLGHSQSRTAGQAMVPIGWEGHDSIRWGLFDINTGVHPQVDSAADAFHANFEHEWGPMSPWTEFPLNRRGIMAYGQIDSTSIDFTNFGATMQQRVYYALPDRLALQFDNGYYWRYNDYRFNPYAKAYNNTYDENDISPYVEYPRNDSIAALTFSTQRYRVGGNIYDSTVSNGIEGRVLLAYSDNRFADQLFRVANSYQLSQDPKTFSANLEFNINTADINTANTALAEGDIPLVRFQILFKKGDSDPDPNQSNGWPVEPFVPFKSAANTTERGWYALVDTIITKNIYNSLPDTWRKQDVKENGSQARSWNFKQLHVMLKDLPAFCSTLVVKTVTDSIRLLYGGGSGAGSITSEKHQDFIVAEDTGLSTANLHLLEFRVLSTYRATVNVRSMTWNDTSVDKLLFRKRANADSTYSCNPDGTPGGFDAIVHSTLATWNTRLGPRRTREMLFNDNYPPFGVLSASTIGYIDYVAAKFNIHTHIREQDFGGWTLPFRRERLSYDGVPPSMFENQTGFCYSNAATFRDEYPLPGDVFPHDYVYYGHSVNKLTTWPTNADDSLIGGLIIGRLDKRGGMVDSLLAYKQYTKTRAGCHLIFPSLRASAKVAMQHPKTKRFAIEAAPQGWGILHHSGLKNGYAGTDPEGSSWYPWYYQRVSTPEEISAIMYGTLAQGVMSYNMAQCFDYADSSGAAPGAFHVVPRDSSSQPNYVAHTYNFGHHISGQRYWNDWNPSGTCFTDNMPAPYYLGYSNTYRAFDRAILRINEVYGSHDGANPYPVKEFEWQNSYSNHRVTSDPDKKDSVTKAASWLKVAKTYPVDPWQRGINNQYIDVATPDSSHRTYVEVGLFKHIKNGSPNYAALVVNTRMWPSLRDQEDIDYYNDGLDSVSKCHSTLGDIDVRKVVLTIDTSKFDDKTFRANYYVVRDLWHQDSQWLVHRDSAFAVYIKPGDAKFLYFEKGISIKASPTSASNDPEVGFNNGRRVAERYKGTKTVECYVRNHNLYVSYASRGATIPGYAEHSDGDNIATGHEELLDDAYCAHPSITVSANDSSMLITYWVKESDTVGRIRVAYQAFAGAPWIFNEYGFYNFPDTSISHYKVTPVVAPLVDTPGGFTRKFVVLAAATTGQFAPYGIYGIVVGVESGYPYFKSGGFIYTDTVKPCLFPTVATRPLDTAFWPVRYAWERYNHIYYAQAKEFGNNLIVNPKYASPLRISGKLPSCDNHHPAIAMNGTYDPIMSVPVGAMPASNKYVDDYVVWESRLSPRDSLSGKDSLWSRGFYWVVSMGSHIGMGPTNLPVGGLSFGGYNIFPVRRGLPTSYRWPVINAEKRRWNNFRTFRYDPVRKVNFHDWIRIGWMNQDSLEFVHWLPNWSKTTFKETGTWPSLPQTTDSLQRWADSSSVPRSMVFLGSHIESGQNDLRITNGWFPIVSNMAPKQTRVSYYRKDVFNLVQCRGVVGSLRFGDGIKMPPPIIPPPPVLPPPVPIQWLPVDISLPTVDQEWPATPVFTNGVHTTAFDISPGTTINITRQADTMDVTDLRGGLMPVGDFVMTKLILRKLSDSSALATLDSLYIDQSTTRWPYYTVGLDPDLVTFTVPIGWAPDSAFVEMQYTRGIPTNDLDATYFETYDADTTIVAEKRVSPSKQLPTASNMQLMVNPNPFSAHTQLALQASKGIQTKVEVFDAIGRVVATLFDGEATEDKMQFEFNGSGLPSGTYLIRAQSGSEVITKRMQLVK